MKKYKESTLRKINETIQTQYQPVLGGPTGIQGNVASPVVGDMGHLQVFYKTVESMTEYPFRSRVTGFAILLSYVSQAILLIVQLWMYMFPRP
jgi:hypothetical protein